MTRFLILYPQSALKCADLVCSGVLLVYAVLILVFSKRGRRKASGEGKLVIADQGLF